MLAGTIRILRDRHHRDRAHAGHRVRLQAAVALLKEVDEHELRPQTVVLLAAALLVGDVLGEGESGVDTRSLADLVGIEEESR